MRKFLAIIFLSLFSVIQSKADNIKDYQIEGISVLDSLTKYIPRDIIEKRKNDYKDKGYIYKLRNFYTITFYKNDNRYKPFINFDTFDELQFHLKDNDSSYEIHAVTGAMHISDMTQCVKELNTIERDFEETFFKKNRKFSKDDFEHISNLGHVKRRVEYQFDKGWINVTCETWKKSTGIRDGLVFDIRSNEFADWVTYKAF